MSVRLFEGSKHADIYSKSRPTVPQNVVEVVLKFLESGIPSNEWQIAVDVGCGGGQGTQVLAKYFKKCFGFDVSEAQISEAKNTNRFDNVFYFVSPAECLTTIETNSVQLLTAFAAAHWFDLKKFFEESDRVLADNGVIALVGYSFPTPIDPDNQDDKSLSQLMIDAHNDTRIAPFNSLKLTPTENHYRDIKFPKNYEFVHKEGIESYRQSNAQTLIGRLESSSRYQVHLQRDKQSAEQLIQEFEGKLKTILKTEKLYEKELILRYDYFIAMGRKKVDSSKIKLVH